MPKQRITKEMILDTAFAIARREGMANVLVKNVSSQLGCSVQPIYSYYKNIEDLRQDLVEHTKKYFQSYLAQCMEQTGLSFRQVGYSYLQFAREESHLFQLLFLRKRQDLHSLQDIYLAECSPSITAHLSKTLQISPAKAKALQMHMAFYTMGISAILATSQSQIPIDQLMSQLESAYQCFLEEALPKEEL